MSFSPHSGHGFFQILCTLLGKILGCIDSILLLCVYFESHFMTMADVPESNVRAKVTESRKTSIQRSRHISRRPASTSVQDQQSPLHQLSPLPKESFAQNPTMLWETFANSSLYSNPAATTNILTSWKDFDMPAELGLVPPGIPSELRNIVKESIDQHQALQISKLDAVAFEPCQDSLALEHIISSGQDKRLKRRNSLVASHQRAPSSNSTCTTKSPSSSNRSSTVYQPIGSTTTLASMSSVAGYGARIYPAPTEMGSQESLKSTANLASLKAPTSKDRLFKDYKLLDLFRHDRKGKGHDLSKPLIVTKTENETKPIECIACFDEIPAKRAIELPCRCHYCSSCFQKLVRTAMQSEGTFPPRCCLQEIPKNILRSRLSPQAFEKYILKASEFAVPASQRWYCTSPKCGKWINTKKAQTTADRLRCCHCNYDMCIHCRGRHHGKSQDCPQDQGLDATLTEARREGWQRCYSCRAMVELATGCIHITCKCKAQFCYVCALKWRTCSCTEEDYIRTQTQIRQSRELANTVAEVEAAEVRAAIEAVDAATREETVRRRQEEAERQAKELRDLQAREDSRLSGVAAWSRYLSQNLEQLHTAQRAAIADRHGLGFEQLRKMKVDMMMLEQDFKNTAVTQKARMIDSHERKTQGLRNTHANEIITTFTRHMEDRGHLMSKIQDSTNRETSIFTLVSLLEQLTEAQEQERAVQKTHQAQDLAKRNRRNASELADLDMKLRTPQMQMEEKQKELLRRTHVNEKQIYADWKWYNFLKSERKAMLEEDERRLTQSGGDAPSIPKVSPSTG